MLLELLMTSCLPPVLDMVLEQIKNYLSIPLALSGSFASIIACRVLSPVWFKVYDIQSFFHSDHFYSASSCILLLRGAPDSARILCRSFKPKHHRQLRANDLS